MRLWTLALLAGCTTDPATDVGDTDTDVDTDTDSDGVDTDDTDVDDTQPPLPEGLPVRGTLRVSSDVLAPARLTLAVIANDGPPYFGLGEVFASRRVTVPEGGGDVAFELRVPEEASSVAVVNPFIDPDVAMALHLLVAWDDLNGDGHPDEGEPPAGLAANFLVWLDGPPGAGLAGSGGAEGWNLVDADISGLRAIVAVPFEGEAEDVLLEARLLLREAAPLDGVFGTPLGAGTFGWELQHLGARVGLVDPAEDRLGGGLVSGTTRATFTLPSGAPPPDHLSDRFFPEEDPDEEQDAIYGPRFLAAAYQVAVFPDDGDGVQELGEATVRASRPAFGYPVVAWLQPRSVLDGLWARALDYDMGWVILDDLPDASGFRSQYPWADGVLLDEPL